MSNFIITNVNGSLSISLLITHKAKNGKSGIPVNPLMLKAFLEQHFDVLVLDEGIEQYPSVHLNQNVPLLPLEAYEEME